MAADHRRKRLNGASIAGSSSRDHYRTKKKKLESFKSDLNAKSHVSLEWDGIQNKVIAKKEQISLSERDLRPFINLIPQRSNVLADVFSVPREIFGFESLKEVLSYEVWQNYLSENERNFLVQFLPGGMDGEEVVEALLSGQNFHFGNPFLEWGSSLCSGNLHPDAVFYQEERLMADKRVYYSEIQKYHADMIKYLQKLKDTWGSSKDPEKEVLQKIWSRSRKGSEKQNSKVKNESRFPDNNAATTSESCSWVAEDKACSSDNQVSSMMKGRSLRNHQKSSTKQKHKNLLVASDDAEKGDSVHKHNIQHSDAAKYMSCLKISKKQHELVKSMSQAGKSIQSKSLNRILGNIDSLHVQPYEEFVKEEKKKLQEHWLQLANIDLNAAYARWREGQLQRREIIMSLGQEMEDKPKSPLEDEKYYPEMVLHDRDDEGERNLKANEKDELEKHGNQLEDQSDQGVKSQETGGENYEYSSSGSPQDKNDGARNRETSVENCEYAGSYLPDCLSPYEVSSLSGGHDSNPKDVGSEDILVASKSGDASPDTSGYSMNGSNVDASIEPVIPFSSGANLYLRDANNADSSIGHRISISSSGNGYSGHADDPDSSIYDGVPISSDGDMYAVDVKNADASNSQIVPISSGGVIYAVDVNNAGASVTQRVPISSGGDMYLVNVKTADSSISQGVPLSSAADMCLEDANNADASIGQGAMPCGGDVWSVVNMEQSRYNSTGKKEYASNCGLSHQVTGQQHPQLMDLESDVHEEDTRKDILHRQCDDGSFGSYPNHDRSGLLQSLFNGQEMLSYQHEQKHTGLDFRPPNNMLQDGVFTGHIQGELQPLMPMEEGKKRSDNYMPQNVTTGIYPEAGGYLIPRQGHVPPVNLPEWAINPVRMPTRIQSHLTDDGMFTRNWFPGEHQVRGGWSGSNGASLPSQNIANNADQSLYNVLSQCNQLRSDRHYDSIVSTEPFMLPRNYTMVSAGAPRISNALPQPTHPLDYLGGCDAGSSLMSDDMGWANLSQNSASHDPTGKPYLRSWNQ